MALENWLKEKMVLAAAEASSTVKQFALETIAETPSDDFTGIREEFARVGVWALQNALPSLRAMADRKQFSVLVGMRPGCACGYDFGRGCGAVWMS